MDTSFQHDLEKLKVDVLTIFHNAREAVAKARQALLARDEGTAREVVDGDEDIDALEIAIDAEILRLLALNQPVARDLRFIVGCMRMVVSIERIGDEASGIAARALDSPSACACASRRDTVVSTASLSCLMMASDSSISIRQCGHWIREMSKEPAGGLSFVLVGVAFILSLLRA